MFVNEMPRYEIISPDAMAIEQELRPFPATRITNPAAKHVRGK
jgi:hypothetical protein